MNLKSKLNETHAEHLQGWINNPTKANCEAKWSKVGKTKWAGSKICQRKKRQEGKIPEKTVKPKNELV